ncbi:ASCH domain-containing protein [Pseudalkalibacillus decolorationis]|uniref:ASCH domain-containing protein n=1 Tax=Pseudalkalibacillus decolorationis TaxID=163879 RepID=UPI002147FCFA|nr:ASCH domain-containing protein [Pseudalkalibacillus decolorationis]
MKVLSIIQPWATLISIGEKRFETRSWRTKHRGELAIHASKKIDKKICRIEPFRSILKKHGFTENNLPVGGIIATSNLSDCLNVAEDMGTGSLLDNGKMVSADEYTFGNFSEGRFAWELQDVIQIKPISAKGQLGLWEYVEQEKLKP